MSLAIFKNDTNHGARLISVRVWAQREAADDIECFGRRLWHHRHQLVEGLRLVEENRLMLDDIGPEREVLYDEAWRAYQGHTQ